MSNSDRKIARNNAINQAFNDRVNELGGIQAVKITAVYEFLADQFYLSPERIRRIIKGC